MIYAGDDGTSYVNKRDEEDPKVSNSQPYIPTTECTLTDKIQNVEQVQNSTPQER